VNQEHLKRTNERELGHRLVPYLRRAGLDPASGPDAGAVAKLLRERVATLAEMADAAHYFYAAPHPTPATAAELLDAASRAALAELATRFATIEWTREAIGAAIKAAAAGHGLKPAQVMMPMRMLVCGTRETPAIDAVLAVLGRERARARMEAGLALAA
jgi:glutamyl-tRNA synthetase